MPSVIDITSSEDEDQPRTFRNDLRTIYEPVVGAVVDALGGWENEVYVMGDDALGCLRDLRTLWRKDDTDDDRTIARICWEKRVLSNDLVPILLQTAGKGLVEDKRAVACLDMITAMTWPIDVAAELQEIDEVDLEADYTQLLASHRGYKAALLKPGVMEAIFGIMLPPLAKGRMERKPKDGQIVNVVLHLIRNLAFIKELPFNANLSAEQAEQSMLQSRFIRTLSQSNMIDVLLTIAANTENDPLLTSWNTIILEILFLLFRGVKASDLTMDQSKQPAETLQKLLAVEDRNRLAIARKATSRHSRFGTTIAVKLNPNKPRASGGEGAAPSLLDGHSSRPFVLHRQQALNSDSGSIMDMAKRKRTKKINKVDDLATNDNLSMEARQTLQNLASEFVDACFNPFLASLLKDIRSERPHVTDKDNVRLLYVSKWFLEFFLTMRTKQVEGKQWHFGRISEATERSYIIWVLKRMRQAIEEKPKLWTEFQGGVECLTQLLLLIDMMLASDLAEEALKEAAEVLQQQLVYSGEVLDLALLSLRSYTPGTQTLTYLDASVHMSYALLRMLERWSKQKGDGTYVRKKVPKKRKAGQSTADDDGIPDTEDLDNQSDDEVVHETLFTFESFEAKFAQAEITQTLLLYLARYREFNSSENMRRVVSLLHRQAVKAKAEGLFFKVSTLDLFKSILADQKSLPREQPYKDLVGLINFVLRQFFKALSEDSFLAIEAFFPKNRGNWKKYSSWQPEERGKDSGKTVVDKRFPAEVEVKKGYSWSDQLGIAIAALVEASQEDLVKWAQEILSLTVTSRKAIFETFKKDGPDGLDEEDDDDPATVVQAAKPSAEALEAIKDYMIPYVTDEQADAATKNPHLKLLFRLAKFRILDEDADEVEWYVPRDVEVDELDRILGVIKRFMEAPFEFGDKSASAFLTKKKRRRRRRSPSPDESGADSADDAPHRRKRKEKRQKEQQIYKSAQFIEDSDEEYGDMEAFLDRERALRERMMQAAESGGNRLPTMKPTGTKKRRKARGEEKGPSKRRKSTIGSTAVNEEAGDSSASEGSNEDERLVSKTPFGRGNSEEARQQPARPRPRPRPRPVKGRMGSSPPASSPPRSSSGGSRPLTPPPDSPPPVLSGGQGRSSYRSKRLVLESDED